MATAKKATKKSAKKTAVKAESRPSTEKTRKGIVAIAVIALVMVGALWMFLNTNAMAKAAVEKRVSATLGVPVAIADMQISLQDKQVVVSDIRVGNPSGYKSPYSVTVGKVLIRADKLSKTLLTFDEISVDATTVSLETHEKGSNLTDIRAHAVDHTAAKKKHGAEEPTKVIIRELNITQSALIPVSIQSEGEVKATQLPPIRLSGIGDKSNGALVSEALAQIMDAVTQVAIRRSLQEGLMEGVSEETLGQMKSDLNLPAGLGEEVKSLGDSIGQSIKNLFGN